MRGDRTDDRDGRAPGGGSVAGPLEGLRRNTGESASALLGRDSTTWCAMVLAVCSTGPPAEKSVTGGCGCLCWGSQARTSPGGCELAESGLRSAAPQRRDRAGQSGAPRIAPSPPGSALASAAPCWLSQGLVSEARHSERLGHVAPPGAQLLVDSAAVLGTFGLTPRRKDMAERSGAPPCRALDDQGGGGSSTRECSVCTSCGEADARRSSASASTPSACVDGSGMVAGPESTESGGGDGGHRSLSRAGVLGGS